ncbi:ATP-binding cassette domain-containing protein [Streptomyces smyrnaeus]|uniref:ATP-binding cassette domain-containing protein n=1 Tax=Streptomyces TaxID=1883 RepID=UPI0027DBBF76|nr:ATP-binding cassette domain-containing protein [Streptomyces sp. RK75]
MEPAPPRDTSPLPPRAVARRIASTWHFRIRKGRSCPGAAAHTVPLVPPLPYLPLSPCGLCRPHRFWLRVNCAAGLDRPTEGTVTIGGTNVAALGERDRTRLRRDRVGFVFQELNPLPALSVRENVALPLLLAEEHGRNRTRERDPLPRADRALALVGSRRACRRRPAQLSGGQRQRVAVVRALVTAPEDSSILPLPKC